MRNAPVLFVLLLSLTTVSVMVPLGCSASMTTVFILPDGTVSPSNIPIQRNGDVYTLTGNVSDPILIRKSNITIDGAGYSIVGPLTLEQRITDPLLGLGPNTTLPPYIIGLDCDKTVDGLTIKNLNIDNFNVGVYLRTTNNTLIGNGVSQNEVGILLSGSANTVQKNYLIDNNIGVFFGFEQVNGSAANIPSDIDVSQNSFVNNSVQLSGCVCKIYNFSEAIHNWDNNRVGNYWSNYNGTDANHDGIGDTYYRIDVLNQDRFPLMIGPAQPPVPTATQFPITILIVGIAVGAIIIALFLIILRTKKKA